MRVTINFVDVDDAREAAEALRDEQHLAMGCMCGACTAYRRLAARIFEREQLDGEPER